jgi:hypothetical protein
MKYLRILVISSSLICIILSASSLYLRKTSLALISNSIKSLSSVLVNSIHYDTLSTIERMIEGLAELVLILSYSGIFASLFAIVFTIKFGANKKPKEIE